MAEKNFQLRIPDGGWGWMVVFGSFMISLLTDGFSYTSGVFYEKFLTEYNQTESVTSIYTSVMTGCIAVVGPVASGLSQVYGCRTVTIIGAIIAVVGMLLSVVLDYNMYCHALTLGVVVGTGLGLMYLPQLTIVTEWFDKRLSFATGLSVCGSGLGMAAFAYSSDGLIQTFGWKGAMQILAFLMALCIIFAFTFREPPYKVAQNEKLKKEPSFKEAVNEAFNFKIFCNKRFVYFVVVNTVASLVYYIPLFLTSDRIKRLKIGDSSDGAQVMVYFGLANAISRTSFGFIADYSGVNRTLLYGVAVTFMGVVIAVTNYAQTLLHMQLLYVGLGITEGAHATLMSVVLVDQFGIERLSNTLGIVLLFDGISSTIGPPAFNLLEKIDSSYEGRIWACAVLTILSGLALTAIPLFKLWLEKPLIDKEAGTKSG